MSKQIQIGKIDDIPVLGARVVKHGDKDIAVFRMSNNEIFAINDECPHRKGQLSQGIVHNKTVTCPLHNWKINLENGNVLAPDVGCTGNYTVNIKDNVIYLEI